MAVRTSLVLVAVAAIAVAGAPLAAQGGPPPLQNLQYFPKDIPRDSLIGFMRGFAMSLGVRCEFCHAMREGAPPPQPGQNPQLNYASDEKDNKKIARYMLRMTDSINHKLLPGIPNRDTPPTTIGCVTCHRGVMKPTTIEAMLLSTTSEMGTDTAVARYRMLRNDMAAGRYNFTEQPVIEVARKLGATGKPVDGVKLLEALQEFFPNSQQIDFEVASLQVAAGNRDAAIARLRAVLAKNPNDRRAQQALQRLGVQP